MTTIQQIMCMYIYIYILHIYTCAQVGYARPTAIHLVGRVLDNYMGEEYII